MTQVNHIPISPVGRLDALGRAKPVEVRTTPPTDTAPTSAPTPGSTLRDTVDLSDRARLLEALRNNTTTRTDLIQRVRDEIADGTYDTPERLDQAIDGLAQDLFS